MGSFKVEENVFDLLPAYCLGVVVAKGIDNGKENDRIRQKMDEACAAFAAGHQEVNIRELPGVKAYREAFQALEMNPNKFMCSIEALMKRVQKGSQLPHINPVVDVGNAFSLTYHLPMGAHDIDKLEGDMEVRFSTGEDHFQSMGEETVEAMPAGELVYVSGHTVKTRRWIWRQSEDGKITGETSHVLFPIDAFAGVNEEAALKARDGLAKLLREEFGCEVMVGWIDREHPAFTW